MVIFGGRRRHLVCKSTWECFDWIGLELSDKWWWRHSSGNIVSDQWEDDWSSQVDNNNNNIITVCLIEVAPEIELDDFDKWLLGSLHFTWFSQLCTYKRPWLVIYDSQFNLFSSRTWLPDINHTRVVNFQPRRRRWSGEFSEMIPVLTRSTHSFCANLSAF